MKSKRLKVTVGATAYIVEYLRGPLFAEGVPCVAGTTMQDARIMIAADCPPGRRLNALAHELARAWSFETGVPRDPEDWFTLCATVATSMVLRVSAMTAFAAAGPQDASGESDDEEPRRRAA